MGYILAIHRYRQHNAGSTRSRNKSGSQVYLKEKDVVVYKV